MLRFSLFDQFPELNYGFSTRQDGSMRVASEKNNRDRYFNSLGIDPARVVIPDMVHGSLALVANSSMGGTIAPDADGLVTNLSDFFLAVTSADCFSVYVYAPDTQAIGIAHSGWRGTLKGIVPATVELLCKRYGSDPGSIYVGIGPGIRACHFSKGPEDESLYARYAGFVRRESDRIFIDLPAIIYQQLHECGVAAERIQDSGVCTFCEKETYFSYRRDRPELVESMIAHIGITGKDT